MIYIHHSIVWTTHFPLQVRQLLLPYQNSLSVLLLEAFCLDQTIAYQAESYRAGY